MDKLAFSIDTEFLDLKNKSAVKSEKSGIKWLLDLLERKNQSATFFVVAELAENHIETLLEIRERGHEIGSHSLTHPYLNELPEMEIHKEVNGSKKILEKELDIKVKGFRAPALSYNETVLSKVRKSGYEYDSSMIPSVRIPGWYGGDEVSLEPFSSNNFTEVPVSVNPITKLPISGFFMRTLGRKHLFWSIELLQNRGVIPVIYLHPFELEHFEGKGKLRRKVRSGKYIKETIRILAEEYEFVKMRDVAAQN